MRRTPGSGPATSAPPPRTRRKRSAGGGRRVATRWPWATNPTEQMYARSSPALATLWLASDSSDQPGRSACALGGGSYRARSEVVVDHAAGLHECVERGGAE